MSSSKQTNKSLSTEYRPYNKSTYNMIYIKQWDFLRLVILWYNILPYLVTQSADAVLTSCNKMISAIVEFSRVFSRRLID